MMAKTSPTPKEAEIERIAGDWVMRLSESALTQQEETELNAWRSANPEHDQVFEAMRRAWNDLDLVDVRAFIGDRASATHSDVVGLSAHKKRRQRSAVVGGLITAVAAAAVLAIVVPHANAPIEREATRIAEIREVHLPDGSVVTLGADSRISTRYSASERRVVLESGEAFFQVVHNDHLPFVVEAGDALIRDVGTKFNVNRASDHVSVAVLEGSVAVRHAPLLNAIARGAEQQLHAGERLDFPMLASPVAFSVPMAPIAPTITPPGAWRDGRLSYNSARLGDLVADLNRYYAPGVQLADSSLADLRVTASFRTDNTASIMDVLDQALPISVTRTSTGAFVVRSPDPESEAAPR